MSKKIVVITGSPRKNGNSFAMTQAFIEAAEKKGHEVTRFDAAMKNVGGCYTNTPLRSEKEAASTMVERERQEEAMDFLNEYIFTEPTWLFDERIANLAEIDVLKTQAGFQRFVIQTLLPKTVFLASCMDLYGREGNYTPEEFFDDLENDIFTELKDGGEISSYRRNLQTEYVRQVMAITKYTNVRNAAGVLPLFILQMENVAKAAKEYAGRTSDESARLYENSLANTIESWLSGEKNGIYSK